MSQSYLNLCVWLCVVLQTQVQNLVEWVKEHENYNSELQEAEKWLLQMSSRLVTSDSMQTSGMEMATQQLARHKVTWTIRHLLLKKISEFRMSCHGSSHFVFLTLHRSFEGNHGGDSQF